MDPYILHLLEHYEKHTRRADTGKLDEEYKKKHQLNTRIEHAQAKPTFLDIAPMYDANVATTDLITEKSTSDVVVGDISDEDLKADLYVVEPLSADASPDILRALLEDALDTLSFTVRKFPTLTEMIV